VQAIAEVMQEEYQAITKAGLLLQIDAPEMPIDRNNPEFRDKPVQEFRKRLELWVEALNYCADGHPGEQVRLHVCWGNSEGPHLRDVPLEQIVDIVLKAHVAAYSIEAANPRRCARAALEPAVPLPTWPSVLAQTIGG